MKKRKWRCESSKAFRGKGMKDFRQEGWDERISTETQSYPRKILPLNNPTIKGTGGQVPAGS